MRRLVVAVAVSLVALWPAGVGAQPGAAVIPPPVVVPPVPPEPFEHPEGAPWWQRRRPPLVDQVPGQWFTNGRVATFRPGWGIYDLGPQVCAAGHWEIVYTREAVHRYWVPPLCVAK